MTELQHYRAVVSITMEVVQRCVACATDMAPAGRYTCRGGTADHVCCTGGPSVVPSARVLGLAEIAGGIVTYLSGILRKEGFFKYVEDWPVVVRKR